MRACCEGNVYGSTNWLNTTSAIVACTCFFACVVFLLCCCWVIVLCFISVCAYDGRRRQETQRGACASDAQIEKTIIIIIIKRATRRRRARSQALTHRRTRTTTNLGRERLVGARRAAAGDRALVVVVKVGPLRQHRRRALAHVDELLQQAQELLLRRDLAPDGVDVLQAREVGRLLLLRARRCLGGAGAARDHDCAARRGCS